MTESSSRVVWNLLLALLVTSLFVTFVLPRPELTTLRPPESVTPGFAYESNDSVSVRLWDDPIAAIARHQMTSSVGDKPNENVKERQCWDPVSTKDRKKHRNSRNTAIRSKLGCMRSNSNELQSQITGDTTILAVTIPGNPFPGSEEFRRKLRLSAVHGLAACGFAPQSTESVRYVQLRFSRSPNTSNTRKVKRTSKKQAHGIQSSDNAAAVRLRLPYEEFEYRGKPTTNSICQHPNLPSAEQSTGEGRPTPAVPKKVIVLWIDEVRLDEISALDRIHNWMWIDSLVVVLDAIGLIQALQKSSNDSLPPYRLGVVGPSGSASLQDAVDKRPSCNEDTIRPACMLKYVPTLFLSPFATSQKQIASDGKKDRFSSDAIPTWSDNGNGYVRTIATDGDVINELMQELRNGGRFDACKDSVLAVTEVDTAYAREMRIALEAALEPQRKACSDTRKSDLPPLIIDATYLVDIDGVQPAKDGDVTTAGIGDLNAALRGALAPRKAEWPEARHQIDYIRRVANAAAARHRTGLMQMEQPVKLVALLGGVVYDKILLLKALRDEFPSAVFVTTDADARLTHPRTIPWTRGLLVGSAHGLELSQDYQQSAPPFRDVYQTSSYLAFQIFAAAMFDPRIGREDHSSEKFHPSTTLCVNPASQTTGKEQSEGNGKNDSCSTRKRISLAIPHVLEVGRDGFLDLTATRLLHNPNASALGGVWSKPRPDGHLASFSKIAPLLVLIFGSVCIFWVAPTSRLLRYMYRHQRRARRDAKSNNDTSQRILRLRHPVQNLQMKALWQSADGLRLHRWIWIATFLLLTVLWGFLCIATSILQIDAVVPYLHFLGHETREPVSITSGTSAWPTLTLRLIVILLTIVLLDRMISESRETLLDIEHAFFPGARITEVARMLRSGFLMRRMLDVMRKEDEHAKREGPNADVPLYSSHQVELRDKHRRRALLVARILRDFGGYMYNIRGHMRRSHPKTILWLKAMNKRKDDGKSSPFIETRGSATADRPIVQWQVRTSFRALTAWRHYRMKRFGPTLFLRLCLWVSLSLVVGIVAMNVSPPPSLPIHGTASRFLGMSVMYMSFGLFIVLLAMMIDHVWLAGSFVQRIANHRTIYPRLSIKALKEEQALREDLSREDMEPWIDVEIIGRLTRVIGGFLTSTFVILALLLLSRSPLFDQWNLHRGIVFTFGVLGTIVLVSMLFLQRKARQAKQAALDELEALRLKRSREGGVKESAVNQIEDLAKMVSANRTGAFSGVYENPIFQGALYPLGGLSALQLIEFFMTSRP